jgi:hypothetical protein
MRPPYPGICIGILLEGLLLLLIYILGNRGCDVKGEVSGVGPERGHAGGVTTWAGAVHHRVCL